MAKKKGGKRPGQGGPTSKGQRPAASKPPAAEPETAASEKEDLETEADAAPASTKDAAAAAPAVEEPAVEKDPEPEPTDDALDEDVPVEKRRKKGGPSYSPPGSTAPTSTAAKEGHDWGAAPPGTRKPNEPPPGASWGRPFVSIEKWWTWFEVRLLVVVILGLVASMVLWISLKGMSSPVEAQSNAGVVFRGIIGAIVFGVGAWFISGRLRSSQLQRALDAIGLMIFGALLAPYWRHVGVEYFGNVQNWLQEGSSLSMFGQLRGVSTRLTVVLAFIGGSLAAASGKHINIDVALRFVPKTLKMPVFVLQQVATVAFCFVAAFGFFEYIAITNFNTGTDKTAGQKYDVVNEAVGQDLFLWRKQIGFDLSAGAHVVGGGKWDDPERLNGRQWNQFLETSGYDTYFSKEQVATLRTPDEYLDESRIALVVKPGPPDRLDDPTPARNLLVRTMNLTFTAGFIFMGLRFLLRLFLVLSGHQSTEPEQDYDPDEDPKRHAEREHAAEIADQDTSKKAGA